MLRKRKNGLKSMFVNNLCFFYHSGAKARRIVGVVTVVREWYAEEEGGGAVDVKAVGEMRRAVDLKEMKGDPDFNDFTLLRQPRLSAVPVSQHQWNKSMCFGSWL